MSRLAGLARTNTADRKDESSTSSSAASTTSASLTSATGAAPSLSALASGSQARPRQRLAGLGRLGASSSSGHDVSAGVPSPSLLSLASARKDGHDRPSLQDLAKGSSSGPAGSRPGSGLGEVSSRPSLAALAQSRKMQESTPNARAAPSSARTSLSQLSSISAGTHGPTSSLGQLASNQNISPRRPLVSLANTSPGTTPARSSDSLLSKDTAPTAAAIEEASLKSTPHSHSRLFGFESRKDHSTLAASPTLSSLASSSLQRRAPLDTLALSTQSANGNELHRSKEQEPTTAYTPASSSIITPSIDSDLLLSSSTATTQLQAHMHKADFIIASNSTLDTEATPAFSSLIAPPSHFAVSIFERLDPVPSPIALTTASILESGMALSGSDAVGPTALLSRSTGAITPTRIFRFDVPSPDDVVFKAQGQRPVVNSFLSKDNPRT